MKTRRWLLLALLMAGMGHLVWRAGGEPAAQAQQTAPSAGQRGAQAPRTLKPGEIELQSSRIYTFVGKTGLGHDHGIEGRLRSGQLNVGAKEKAGRLEFDLRTFVADTAAARQYVGLAGQTDRKTADKVTANMLSAAVLDVARFPIATFDVASVVPLPRQGNQPQQYQLIGDFTLHGVKRQIRFQAQGDPVQGFLRLRGQFSIRQTDFGITPYTQALGAVGVADQLTIHGDLYVMA
ncbi:MAG: YceI family protein, partial [Planctomycetaceae bacterium]